MSRLKDVLQILVAVTFLGLGGLTIWKLLSGEVFKAQPLVPNAVPFSLTSTMPLDERDLYWFGLEIENETDAGFNGMLKLTPRGGYGVTVDEPVTQLWVDVGQNKVAVPTRVRNLEAGQSFRWEWELQPVQRGEAEPLYGPPSENIEILPLNVLNWDLETWRKDRVPSDLILATLSAWTHLHWRGPACQMKVEIQEQVGGNDPRSFMGETVRRIFKAGLLTVGQQPNRLPMQGQRKIERPDKLLRFATGTSVRPIEAALLLTGMMRKYSRTTKLRFFVLAEPDSGEGSVLLAWEGKGGVWEAIAVTDIQDVGFDVNVRTATERLSRLFETQPEVSEGLQSRGLFVEGNGEFADIVALEFEEIEAHFGLPSPAEVEEQEEAAC